MRALIVDDSSTIRRIQIRLLTSMGFEEFVEARDGKEALFEMERGRFDLVTLDLNMPRMGGLEFLSEIRKTDRETPIVVATSDADRMTVIMAAKKGANQYIIKPFTPDVFRAKIQRILPKEGSDEQSGKR